VDQPRKVYNPSSLALEGLLIEEQRTNVLLHNRDLSQSAWVKNDGPVITYDQTGLDGQASAAATVADNSTGLIAGVEQSVTIVADSATHVGMFIVGKNASPSAYPGISMQLSGGTKVEQQYTVNPANGAIVGRPSFNTGTATLIDETPDFWLFQITATNNNTNSVLKWRFFPAVNEAFSGTWDTVATGSNVIDYPQVELNTSFATSPIETGASQVTRSADDARVPIGGEFNAGEFSFVYEGTMPLSSNSGRIYEYGPSTSNRILIYRNGSNVTLLVVSGGSNVVVSSVAGPAGGDPIKVAVRIQENNVALSVNGGAPIIDTLVTIPETTVRTVGHTASGFSYGNIAAKNITEYARALSDAELQELSTL
uniref:phage head spike fiber domain-containing protein n=1 Tax=Zhongshania sp. TaxID=1971902 RepID=UPI003564DF89